MKNRKLVWMIGLMLVSVLVLGACAPTPAAQPDAEEPNVDEPAVDEPAEDGEAEDGESEPLPEITDGSEAAPGDVISAAIAAVVAEFGVDAGDVIVVSAEQVDWTDSCLGLGGPAESCLAAITPGYQIIVEAGGDQIEVRTDTTGQAVRIAPSDMGDATVLPEDVLSAALDAVADEYGVDAVDVSVVFAEPVDWTDGCLGLGGPAESCLAAITPGYRIIVNVGGEEVEVRTDTTGEAVRIAPSGLDS